MERAVPSVFPALVERERIRLHEVTIDDIEATWVWASRPEFFRFLPIDEPTRAEEREWLSSVVDESHEVPRRQQGSASKLSTVPSSSAWSASRSTPNGTGAPVSIMA